MGRGGKSAVHKVHLLFRLGMNEAGRGVEERVILSCDIDDVESETGDSDKDKAVMIN